MDRRGFLKGTLSATVVVVAAKLGIGEPEVSQAKLDEFAAAAKDMADWGLEVAEAMTEVAKAMRHMQSSQHFKKGRLWIDETEVESPWNVELDGALHPSTSCELDDIPEQGFVEGITRHTRPMMYQGREPLDETIERVIAGIEEAVGDGRSEIPG